MGIYDVLSLLLVNTHFSLRKITKNAFFIQNNAFFGQKCICATATDAFQSRSDASDAVTSLTPESGISQANSNFPELPSLRDSKSRNLKQCRCCQRCSRPAKTFSNSFPPPELAFCTDATRCHASSVLRSRCAACCADSVVQPVVQSARQPLTSGQIRRSEAK